MECTPRPVVVIKAPILGFHYRVLEDLGQGLKQWPEGGFVLRTICLFRYTLNYQNVLLSFFRGPPRPIWSNIHVIIGGLGFRVLVLGSGL